MTSWICNNFYKTCKRGDRSICQKIKISRSTEVAFILDMGIFHNHKLWLIHFPPLISENFRHISTWFVASVGLSASTLLHWDSNQANHKTLWLLHLHFMLFSMSWMNRCWYKLPPSVTLQILNTCLALLNRSEVLWAAGKCFVRLAVFSPQLMEDCWRGVNKNTSSGILYV